MAKRNGSKVKDQSKKSRRQFDKTFKQEAVHMMLDGHSASLVSQNLGTNNTNLLYRWKSEVLYDGGQSAVTLDARVRESEEQLRRVERERHEWDRRLRAGAVLSSACCLRVGCRVRCTERATQLVLSIAACLKTQPFLMSAINRPVLT
jgi:transposase